MRHKYSGTVPSVVDPDPHHFGNLDPHQIDKLDPDPHQFADDMPKCTVWNMSLFGHFFTGLSLYFEAGI